MINYFRREFGKLFLSVIVIICIYNSVNLTFFNEKSVTKIFEMNENILLLSQELLDLQQIEEKLTMHSRKLYCPRANFSDIMKMLTGASGG